jgi:hypothetical protein
MYNTYCFSTATVVPRTQLTVALYVQYNACIVFFLLTRGLNSAVRSPSSVTMKPSIYEKVSRLCELDPVVQL